MLLLLGASSPRMPFSVTHVGSTCFRGTSCGAFGRVTQHDIALDVFVPAYTGEVRVRLANDNRERRADV